MASRPTITPNHSKSLQTNQPSSLVHNSEEHIPLSHNQGCKRELAPLLMWPNHTLPSSFPFPSLVFVCLFAAVLGHVPFISPFCFAPSPLFRFYRSSPFFLCC